MHLSYFIARRYLFAKKSHNVINIISLISAIGIAVGSCALIMVLSIMPSVASFTESVEETVFLTYDREEGTALLKGVEQSYTENPEIQSCIIDGEFTLMHGEDADWLWKWA